MRKAVTFASLLALLGTNAYATPIRDQGFDPSTLVDFGGGLGDDDFQIAQTFTVGVTGTLSAVDVFINATVIPGALTVRILPTVGGIPEESLALSLLTVIVPPGTVHIDPPHLTAFHKVDVSAFNLSVASGDVLAMVLSATGNYGFGGQAQNPYPRGQFFERRTDISTAWQVPSVASNADMGFYTYVEPVPEPAAGLLTLVGVAASAALRRRFWASRTVGRLRNDSD